MLIVPEPKPGSQPISAASVARLGAVALLASAAALVVWLQAGSRHGSKPPDLLPGAIVAQVQPSDSSVPNAPTSPHPADPNLDGVRASAGGPGASAPKGKTSPESGYVLQLPEAANVPALLFTAQRAASSSRVSILAATRKDFASNTQTLGAAEISLSATGTYADLKAWLSRVLQEHPNAVLTHLVMARVSGTETTLRSDVTLTLLTKPMAHSNVLPAATAAATEPAPGNGQASQHP